MAKPSVGLFVTCLVDFFRPSIAQATLKLLKQAGCQVAIPSTQTCCGQVTYNNGHLTDTQAIAKQVITAFEPFDYIVTPSGSCAGMLRKHYLNLFTSSNPWQARANALAERCYELSGFLVDVLDFHQVDSTLVANATYHDSCASLREMNLYKQPRQLLALVDGLKLTEMSDSEVCCGFGGMFCTKYPQIATRLVDDKCTHAINTHSDTLLGGDLGCLLNIAGRLNRRSLPMRVFHFAEVLATMTEQPINYPLK